VGLTAENAASAAPVWGVVAEMRSQRFTGRVAVGAAPRVTMWCRDGQIYLAERDDDAALQTRLVMSGLVSPEDLAHGVTLIDGRISLSRLFQRVPRLDRQVVLGAVQRWNDATLDAIADLSADPVEREDGAIHPADIDDWLAPSVPLTPAAPLLPLPTLAAAPLSATSTPSTGRVATPPPVFDDMASRIWQMVDSIIPKEPS
jgi:hypothetical protein